MIAVTQAYSRTEIDRIAAIADRSTLERRPLDDGLSHSFIRLATRTQLTSQCSSFNNRVLAENDIMPIKYSSS